MKLPFNYDRIAIGDFSWQPVFAGSIFTIVGFNALMLGIEPAR